jgi:hypothetical protein
MSLSCCGTGAPSQDLALSSLCTKKLTSCSATFEVVSANTANIPDKTTVFANETTLLHPFVVVLRIAELSQAYDPEAQILSVWPNIFVQDSSIGYNPFIGLYYSFGSSVTGTYFQWNNVYVQHSGVYSLRSIFDNQTGNGQYTLFIDDISTGLTVDFSAETDVQAAVKQWTGFTVTKGLHNIKLLCTAPGTGNRCDFAVFNDLLLAQIE